MSAPTKTFGGQEAADLAGISYRKLDYWCRTGVLGAELQHGQGSGYRRQLTATDVTLLRCIGRVSDALTALGSRRNAGSIGVYRSVADQVLAGALVVRVQLSRYAELTIDVEDLVGEGEA